MIRTRRLLVVLVGVLVASTVLLPQAGARPADASARVPALAPAGSTPALIEAAVGRGEIGRNTADRYLAYALDNPSRLPAAYRSDVP